MPGNIYKLRYAADLISMTITLPASATRGRLSPGFIWLLATVALLTAAIWPALTVVSGFWTQDEYSHAWLIGPLAALLLLHRLPTVAPDRRTAAGPALAAGALALLALGWLTRNGTLSLYGAIAGVVGLVWAALGQSAMRRLTAPILLLLFTIPLPLAVYISLSQAMQLLSSRLGVDVIRLFGIVVVRDGNIIDLANGQLEVAEACSGLRYLFPLLAIASLLAMLMEDRLWKKTVVLVSAVPIALVMNGLRLALIGVLVDRFGLAMAQGPQHEIEGFAVFAICIGLLLAELHILLGVGRRGRFPAADVLWPRRRALAAVAAWPAPGSFRVAAGLLVAGAVVLLSLPQRTEIVPERRALTLFPLQIGAWRGLPHALDPESLRALGLTDYVMADFADPAQPDSPVNFYAAYYASQRPGVQVHSPRLCIPGGGWDMIDQRRIELPTEGGALIRANRVVIEKGGARQVVYYWFEERGRHLVDETEIKAYALLDAMIRNRSDGALVRLVAPVIAGDEARADRALRALVGLAAPMLPIFVPG